MKSPLSALLPVACLMLPLHVRADEAAKTKMLETFKTLDSKTIHISEVKVRLVSAPEVPHKRAVEITADYAKPGVYHTLAKRVPPEGIDPKKYKGIRFLLKSPTESTLHFCLHGKADSGGSPCDFRVLNVKGGPEWKPFYFDFSSFRFHGSKSFRDGQQVVFPAADFTEKDFKRVLNIVFGFHEAERGNSTVSNVQLADLELVAR